MPFSSCYHIINIILIFITNPSIYWFVGVEKNEEKAVQMYKLAAAQGYSAAQFNLGGVYWSYRTDDINERDNTHDENRDNEYDHEDDYDENDYDEDDHDEYDYDENDNIGDWLMMMKMNGSDDNDNNHIVNDTYCTQVFVIRPVKVSRRTKMRPLSYTN